MLFWSKKLRKEVARIDWDNALGRTAGALRDISEFIVGQSKTRWLWFHMAILKGVWIIEVNGGVDYSGPAERQDTKRNII